MIDIEINEAFLEKLKTGLRTKEEYFGSNIYFYGPGFKHYEVEDFKTVSKPRFVDISITGKKCELMCDHCASKILHHMIPATSPEELIRVCEDLKEAGVGGILISGGSNKDNVVELYDYKDAMIYAKKELGLIVTCHVGLVDERLAKTLKEAEVDAVLLDIIGEDETIHKVYKLPHKSTKDYDESLRLLKEQGLKIVPHIIIGLHYGKIIGEFNAVDMISKYDPDALVLVVVMPYYGNARYQLIKPPSAEEAAEVILYARQKMPKNPIIIGCARPAGEYRLAFDTYAMLAGANGIAFPAEGIVSQSMEFGMKPHISPNCCSTVIFDIRDFVNG